MASTVDFFIKVTLTLPRRSFEYISEASQFIFTCSKSAIETLEQGVKYLQS